MRGSAGEQGEGQVDAGTGCAGSVPVQARHGISEIPADQLR